MLETDCTNALSSDEDELLARLRRSGAYAAAVDAVQQAVDQLQV